ncbi:hypothetical protein GCM10007989_03490 [Devosia pacifica]|uniref:Uncharacterized protein n=1 Tax=Devosia pacifica TaxID=1335967 RepID=A0A918VPJ7_9HYPH|nr:hypothetical protein [Devosia pacifica]GHA12341.1 hypothetical protein GCM10007989_03490 [Devosia pacifica]
MAPASNVDKLRHDIDSGKTGDKVEAADPATVPLGTDAEASGNPPTSAQVRQAEEPKRKNLHPREFNGFAIYIGLVVAVGTVLLLAGAAAA